MGLEQYIESYTDRGAPKVLGARAPERATFSFDDGSCTLRVAAGASSPYFSLGQAPAFTAGGGTQPPRRPAFAVDQDRVIVNGYVDAAEPEELILLLGPTTWAAAAPFVRLAPDEPPGPEEMSGAPEATLIEREIPAAARAATEDALSVTSMASRVATLSGLSDQELAKLFRVERETFCRWRTGALTNPRIGNRRRLGALLRVLEDLHTQPVDARDWLLNSVNDQGLTAYDLLERGRIDTVARQVASAGTQAALSDIHGPASATEGAQRGDLVFGDDDAWEMPDLDDES